jgi:FkbM family methyltransferase
MSIVARAINKFKLTVLSSQLKIKHLFSKDDLYIDYGWIKLIFSNDGDVQELFYHQGCLKYYENDSKIFSQYIKQGDAVIDVGANLGFLATMFASFVGSQGKVFCFEPSKPIYSKLLKTISKNNLSQVVPYNLGCGKEHSKLKLNRVNSSSGNNSLVNPDIISATAEEIEIVPLDSIDELKKVKINFMKIDTEGFEPEVLLGAKELIAANKPIIYIEMGGDYLESTQRSLKILDEYGYKTDIPEDMDWNAIGNGCNFLSFPRQE